MATESMVLAGRYRLVEQIASGGLAEVWRADDVALQRQVAVKLVSTLDVDQSVWQEAQDVARLVHPNIVGVYDVAADAERVFVIMEFVAGRDIAAVLREQGPLPPARVAEIGAQTARALAAAHAVGIVHRDVKPGNLLLASDGTVKLADFGTATTSPAPGSNGAYLSPEHAAGRPVGPAGDLYALGCLLYELLIGWPPFVSDDPTVLLRRHVQVEPVPPGRLRPDMPVELEHAVMRLLAKDPAGRPDASQAAEALQQICDRLDSTQISSEPMPSTPTPAPSPPEHAGQPSAAEEEPVATSGRRLPNRVRQRPLVAVGAAVGAVGAVVAALVVITQSGDSGSHPPVMSMPATSASAESSSSSPSLSPSATATAKPSAKKSPSRQPRSQGPAQLLSALEGRLNQQVASGRLDSKVDRDIGRQISRIRQRLSQDRTDDLAARVTDIRQELDDAAQRGDWTPDSTVSSLLNQLAAGA